MKRHTAPAAALLVAVALVSVAQAGLVVEWWGGMENCRHKTMKVHREPDGGGWLTFDLSALRPGAKIYHASLRMSTDKPKLTRNLRAYMRGGYYDPLRLNAEVTPTRPVKIFVRTDGKPTGEPLKLEGPRFGSFDVTAAVRDWVAGTRKNEGFIITDFQFWTHWQSVLEIRYEGTVAKPPRQASNLKAVHRKGQTFLTWTEIDKLITADPIRWKAFNEIFLKSAPKMVHTWWKLGPKPRRTVLYRIYRSAKPITAENLAEATRVDEIYPLSGYDGRIHQHTCRGENWTGLDPNVIVPRYVITDPPEGVLRADGRLEGCKAAKGQPQWTGRQLPMHTGLYVHQPRKAGKVFYAVTVLVNGVENTAAVTAANALVEPVDETVAPGEPILYRVLDQTQRRGRDVRVRETQYSVYWAAPPYDPRVRQPAHIMVSFPDGPAPALRVRHGFGDMYWSEIVAGTHPYQWKRGQRILTVERSTPNWESGRNTSVYTLKKSVPDVRVPYAENLDKLLKPWALEQTRRLSGAVR